MTRETEIAMIMRLWSLGVGLTEIAAALATSPRVAAGIVHRQLCAYESPEEAARDARLCRWWQSLTEAARDVRAGRRTAANVATEYGTTSQIVREVAMREPARDNRRGPSLRTPTLGRLYTAWEYGIAPAEAAEMIGMRIRSAQRYYQRLNEMSAAQRIMEAARVEADRWIIVGHEFVMKEDLKNEEDTPET